MSIREIAQKIKQKVRVWALFPPTDLLIVAIIILVGFGSFGLGRLSVQDAKKTSVVLTDTIREAKKGASVGNIAVSASGGVVSSRNGSKYHFPWCGVAQWIAERNLISFISIEAAKKAGYTPAANCKGLE